MANKPQLLPDDKYREIIEGGTIRITAKTVQFGPNVFQFHNVTGFGLAKIETIKIPLLSLIVLFIIGWIIASIPNLGTLGVIIILIVIAVGAANYTQPQQYGLAIYLNSGHQKVFLTTDVQGLKQVVEELYEYMETNKDGGYVINNTISGNFSGNFIGRDASGGTIGYLK